MSLKFSQANPSMFKPGGFFNSRNIILGSPSNIFSFGNPQSGQRPKDCCKQTLPCKYSTDRFSDYSKQIQIDRQRRGAKGEAIEQVPSSNTDRCSYRFCLDFVRQSKIVEYVTVVLFCTSVIDHQTCFPEAKRPKCFSLELS